MHRDHIFMSEQVNPCCHTSKTTVAGTSRVCPGPPYIAYDAQSGYPSTSCELLEKRLNEKNMELRTSLLYKSLALNEECMHIMLVKDKVKHKWSQAFVSSLNFEISIEGSNIANGSATSVATTTEEISRILYCPPTLSCCKKKVSSACVIQIDTIRPKIVDDKRYPNVISFSSLYV